MDIVKKNLLSIICGVVALIAVVALFYPLGGTIDKLKGELETRKGAYATLEGLRTKQRNLPVIDPDHPEPQPLGRFPNDEIIKQGEAIPKAFQDEATNIVEAARKMNVHQPLVAGALPQPSSSTYTFQFRDRYREWAMFTPPQGGTLPQNSFRAMLHAGYPPTQQDVQMAVQKLWDEKYAPMVVWINNQPRNLQSVQQQHQAEAQDVPGRLKSQVANESIVYMEPNALTLSQVPTLNPQNMQPGAGQPSAIDMWYAQLGVWIQNDVAGAILRTNAGSKNVTEAPVKHLVKIDVPQNVYVLPPTYQPNTVIEGDPKAAVTKDTTVSATGRLCNPLYDVVKYDLTVNVEADRLPWFLKELGNGQFITVLRTDIKSIDLGVQRALGFMYGEKPVVQVKFTCEQLFFHDWSRPLMPTEVAKNMGSPTGMPMGGPMMGAPEDMMGGPMRY